MSSQQFYSSSFLHRFSRKVSSKPVLAYYTKIKKQQKIYIGIIVQKQCLDFFRKSKWRTLGAQLRILMHAGSHLLRCIQEIMSHRNKLGIKSFLCYRGETSLSLSAADAKRVKGVVRYVLMMIVIIFDLFLINQCVIMVAEGKHPPEHDNIVQDYSVLLLKILRFYALIRNFTHPSPQSVVKSSPIQFWTTLRQARPRCPLLPCLQQNFRGYFQNFPIRTVISFLTAKSISLTLFFLYVYMCLISLRILSIFSSFLGGKRCFYSKKLKKHPINKILNQNLLLKVQGDLIYQQQFLMSMPTLTLQLANSLSNICGTVSEHLKLARRTLPAENNSDSESFQPEYHQIKKLGFKINKKKICSGGWSTHENQVYLQFMIQNSQDFMSETSRRKTKVFYRLSKILKRRTPDQCRSHHQKLQLKYKEDLRAIINEVERKVHTCALQEYMSQQQLLQRRGTEPVAGLPVEEGPPTRKFKTVSKSSWYSIRSSGSCFKLSIDSDSIAEW